MTEPVGFIGLGAMGLPMIRGLAVQGYSLLVYDIEPEALKRAAEIPRVSLAEDRRAVAAGSRFLFTCLPDDAVLLDAYLGSGGIAEALTEGMITIDCSTVSPSATHEVSTALAARGVSHLDASMLGSVPQAEAGEIGFVVGGDRAAFDAAAPLFDYLGRFCIYAGGSGSANRIKLIHQTLVAANAVAVAEAVALCLATDTDLDCFYEVVCRGGGFAYSRYFEMRVPRMRDGDYSPLFMLKLMKKDAALGRDLAGAVGLEMPLLNQVVARFEEAQEGGWSEEDFSAVARLYEAALGGPFAEGGTVEEA